MKIKYTPFIRCVERNIDDTAQSAGGLRDVMNLIPNVTGRLDGLYTGNIEAKFTGVFNRVLQWGAYTLGLKSNPESTIQLGDSSTAVIGPSGDGRATLYKSFAPLAIKDDQARILSIKGATTFTDGAAYIGLDIGTGWGLVTSTSGAGPTYTVNFATAGQQPEIPAGKTAQYIVFDIDGGEGSQSAEIRPITSVTGSPITSLDYTGTTPPSATFAFLIYGTSSTDTFKPDGFVTHRERLAAYKDNTLYYSGFIGSPTVPIDPDPLNPYFWYELNSVTVGNSAQGKIIRCMELGDAIIVFLEKAIYRVSGYPPVNGAYENQLVVQELSNDLGITSYDAAALSTDGGTAFFIGNDQRIYQMGAGFNEISEAIREHPRFRKLTHVNCTDRYAIFTGEKVDASLVPNELYPNESGIRLQTPAAFAYHTQKGIWAILDPFRTNSLNELLVYNDASRFGIFSAYEKDERTEISLATPTGLTILNDGSIRNPDSATFLAQGLNTHQIPIDNKQIRIDQVNVQAENVQTAQLSIQSPSENPTGASPSDIARGIAQNINGATSMYGNYLSEPAYNNFASVAVGYGGDILLAGQPVWTDSLTTVASGLYESFEVSGWLDRVDVLVSDQTTDIQVTIYSDTSGLPNTSDVLYDKTYGDAFTGRVNDSTKKWLPIPIGINVLDRPIWVKLTGAQLYKYPSGGDIFTSSAVSIAGQSFCCRVILEAGKAFASKSILSVEAHGEVVSNEF
jgi:hypothetical protein